jgi:RND family efflux transporter MFP subunit
VSKHNPSPFWFVWGVGLLATVALLVGGGYYALQTFSARPAPAHAGELDPSDDPPPVVRVEVVRPQKGGVDHTTTQPGTVLPFESARLVAEATGYLKRQTVDIGDRVARGQVLAEVDVPDLRVQVERHEAVLERSRALVAQMNARVDTARAELDEARAGVDQALATAKSTGAALRYRQTMYEHMKELLAERSIQGKVVDEEHERRDAALEARNAADAAVVTARAKVVAVTSKIEQARADVAEAQAEVKVSKAQLDAAKVAVGFATLRAPFDGVITQRSKFPGDFVRSAAGSATAPLLTVQRTDKFRVVVLVPDQDVPYVDVGDPAVIEFNTMPGQKFSTQVVPGRKEPQPIAVSRLAESEDPQTRLMRVEVDLYNQGGKIKAGTFANVTIILDRSSLLSLPSSCVVNRTKTGKADVFVVRGGRACRKAVQFAGDNGARVAIRAGVGPDDRIILHPPQGLEDGEPVTVAAPPATHAAAAPR